MKTWFRDFSGLSRILVVVCLVFLTGCAHDTQALFTKPSLAQCSRMAVLGLTEEQEQIFMASYIKTFNEQNITFVERGQLQRIISEQDLLAGRLNERSRAKIAEILGVKALILCTYYDASSGSLNKKLRVKVVDSETGAILGSVITKANDNFTQHCYTASRALKADLNGDSAPEYQVTKRSYNSPGRW